MTNPRGLLGGLFLSSRPIAVGFDFQAFGYRRSRTVRLRAKLGSRSASTAIYDGFIRRGVFGLAPPPKFFFLARMIFSFGSRSVALRRAFLVITALVAGLATDAVAANARSRPTRKAETDHSGIYRGYVVMDAADGRILAEENGNAVTPPASMTKLMTFAVLHDRLASGQISLSTPVKIDDSDARMGGTQVFLDPKETFPVEELIYAMMIQSANDAAHALARASAGSVEGFVEEMNAKARELGMTNTTFRSPHGLPPKSRRIGDGDLTTPHDFAILCRHLLLKTDVLKYTSVTKRNFAPERPKGPMVMDNHNKLLGKVSGVDGLKTGYTEGAGYCLSATAERNGRRVIVVIMGAFGPGGKVDLGRSRDMKTVELLEKGFAAIPMGSSNFAAERAKYVKPAVIAIEGSSPAASAATTAVPSTTPLPEAPSPAADPIKFTLPGVRK